MKINSTACCAILCAALTFSCSNDVKRIDDRRIMIGDDVYLHIDKDSYFYNEDYLILFPILDSLSTSVFLDKEIATGILTPEKEYCIDPMLYDKSKDLTLLPYYLDAQINNPYSEAAMYNLWVLFKLCTERTNDNKLLKLCKSIAPKTLGVQYRNDSIYLFDILNARFQENWTPNDKLWRIDSLRIRAIAHNDRSALTKLEKYYHNKGDDKGIAIYYKLMLNYEGNGDLAERFYHVLEPYFDSIPEFRLAVHEVLLRAAYCDNDKRAQQLCDSLGFSLCDYRLPSPTE